MMAWRSQAPQENQAVSTLKNEYSIRANPVKTGDAKPWILMLTYQLMTARLPKVSTLDPVRAFTGRLYRGGTYGAQTHPIDLDHYPRCDRPSGPAADARLGSERGARHHPPRSRNFRRPTEQRPGRSTARRICTEHIG